MSVEPAVDITHTLQTAEESQITQGEPAAKSDGRDLILPSVFVSAAGLILAALDPMYVRFEAKPLETLGLTAVAVVVLWWGTLVRRPIIMYAGVAALLLITTIGTVTQPTRLSVPIVAVWPLRVILVLLVAWSWAFLMRPPRWLNRALLATVVPTLLVFGAWGGPALGASLFNWNVVTPVTNFAPYWLAIDSHNTIYATDASGDLIWVFDEGGSPQGTIRASRAPQVGTPGPGILPNGLVEELNLTNVSIFPTAVPVTATLGFQVLDFCGIAIDPSDNIYTVDTYDPLNPVLLRFDREGTIKERLPTPPNYLSTKGCLAADAEHIYLSSSFGKIYIMDHAARIQHEIQVAYRPLGIFPNGKGELLVTQPNIMNTINVSTGSVVTSTLPVPVTQNQVRIPYQAILVRKNGEIVVSDWSNNQILRIDPKTNKIIGSIGKPGFWPGEFQGLGGVAEDKEGRIYVADWQHRVIQRFTDDGHIDALWWAARAVPESATGEVERDR